MTITLPAPLHIREIKRGTELDAALTKVGAFLAKEGLTDSLAIQVLHRHFPVSAGEALLEVTDEPARVQVTRVVPRSQVTDDQAATWRFTPDGRPVTMGWCSDKGQGSFH